MQWYICVLLAYHTNSSLVRYYSVYACRVGVGVYVYACPTCCLFAYRYLSFSQPVKLQRPTKAAAAPTVVKPKAVSKAISDSESSEDESLSERHARLKKVAKKSKVTVSAPSVAKKKKAQISDDDDDDIMHVATVKETHAERAARTLAEAKANGDFMDLGDDDDEDDDAAAAAAAEPAIQVKNEVSSSVDTSADGVRVYNAVCAGSKSPKTTSEIASAISPSLPLETVKFHLYELTAKGKVAKVAEIPATWQVSGQVH